MDGLSNIGSNIARKRYCFLFLFTLCARRCAIKYAHPIFMSKLRDRSDFIFSVFKYFTQIPVIQTFIFILTFR